MKDVEKLRQQYEVYCIINNLAESNQGFKGYVSDQKMLERIREARRKREQNLG